MQSISTIGLDIAKSVFQVHGVDAAGQVILRRQLRRRRNDPGKERIRKWLIDIDDAKLQSDLGLTLEDIAVLREWYAPKPASTSRSD